MNYLSKYIEVKNKMNHDTNDTDDFKMRFTGFVTKYSHTYERANSPTNNNKCKKTFLRNSPLI